MPVWVTAGAAGVKVALMSAVPNLTVLAPPNVAPGPNPVAVTVTTVPVGPEVGERVTVGVVKVKAAVAMLP